MSDLFMSVEEVPVEEGTRRGIPGGTLVKAYATELATKIMGKIPQASANGDEEFLLKVKDSQTSVAALDDLVKSECGEALVHEDVKEFGEDEVAKLLKSNQSNRSRRKNMPMTQANYMEYLTAACAEWILRESCGITKSANPFGGQGRQAMVINDETLAMLENDQEALGRAIRNQQSKKSTYKAKHQDKEGWEEAEEYQEILATLEKLKAIRTTQPAGRKGVSIKKALQFIFDGVDETQNLHREQSMEIIEACRNLAKGVYPSEYIDMVEAKQAAKEAAEAEAAAAEAVSVDEDDSVYSEEL